MGGIAPEHVEWAIVNRMKTMLDVPPKTKFNVTQSFALFTAILLWTKNRAWVPDHEVELADEAARRVRNELGEKSILQEPWSLSRVRPQFKYSDAREAFELAGERVNDDFENMSAELFIKWLRDALAHGDGRSIKPIHKPSRSPQKTWLAGFEIVFAQKKDSKKNFTLMLYHADMQRIGAILADAFCRQLSGGNRYFEEEAGTQNIEEAA